MRGTIYTCYFAGLGGRLENAVSITLQQPPKFNLPVARELCPPFGMYWKFMRGLMSQKQFAQIYSNRFGVLDPEEIADKYDGKILVSWEGYEDKAKTITKFSHRNLVAEWLRKNGYTVVELEPITSKRKVLG